MIPYAEDNEINNTTLKWEFFNRNVSNIIVDKKPKNKNFIFHEETAVSIKQTTEEPTLDVILK